MARWQMEKWIEGLVVLVFVGLSLGPALALMQDLLGAGAGIEMFSSRQLVLLGNSVIYAAVSAWGALAVGTVIAALLWSYPGRLSQIIKLLLILMLPMPSFVHAAGWRAAWRFLNDVFGCDISGQGWIAAVLITIMAFLPIAVGAAWLGLQAVDRDLIGAGRVCRPDLHVFGEIILPLAAPFLAAGAAVISVLSLLDYTIPSLCQVNVYALDIFADFSAGNSPGRSFILALPLIVVNTTIVGWLISRLRGAGMSGIKTKQNDAGFIWPAWFWSLLCLGAFVAVLQAGTPLIMLLFTALSGDVLWRQIGFAPEMSYSIEVALGVGAAAVLLSYPVAKRLNSEKSRYLWPLVLLPLVLPAPLTGIGLVKVGNMIPGLYGSDFMPVMAGLARFIPLAVVMVWAGLRRLDPLLIEAGRAMQVRPGQALFGVELPLLSPILLAVFLLLFVLSFGELGATLMVVPPGRSTLTITIYNYLHFGASGSVAALCLFSALLSCLIWGGGLKIMELRRRYKEVSYEK